MVNGSVGLNVPGENGDAVQPDWQNVFKTFRIQTVCVRHLALNHLSRMFRRVRRVAGRTLKCGRT